MDEKRLKQAEQNFKRFLDEKLIIKQEFKQIIYDTFVKNANESLTVAEELFKNKTSALWTIVSSYYSMFYMASALIYTKRYKAQHKIVHQIINETLIVLCYKEIKNQLLEEYEEEKEKALSIAENLLNNYEFEKNKRSKFQYETTETIKFSKAETSLKRAKEFMAMIRKII